MRIRVCGLLLSGLRTASTEQADARTGWLERHGGGQRERAGESRPLRERDRPPDARGGHPVDAPGHRVGVGGKADGRVRAGRGDVVGRRTTHWCSDRCVVGWHATDHGPLAGG